MCLLGLAHKWESESPAHNDIWVDWFIYVVGDRKGEAQHGIGYSEVFDYWNGLCSLSSMVKNRTLSTSVESRLPPPRTYQGLYISLE